MTADLFSYKEEELVGEDAVVTFYEILGVELHATQDAVKKAFRRLSLRYHPDKTLRGDDDYVFRAVKAAYDTLYDPLKRQAYDSTKVPFDDDIPGPIVTESDFFDVYGPVFERNLRFDARLRPELKSKSNNSSNNKRNHRSKASAPPRLGDDDTPLHEVNEFYSYWIHFDSWRDFSAQATEELQVESHLENAESRDERRWLQREIEKRAKQLKKLELNRIQTLVERAMEADPRLKRQRALEKKRKQEQEAEKLKAVQEQKRLEQEKKLEQELKDREERERQAMEKAEREKEKKLLRKARQQLRKMTSSMEGSDVSADVDLLCSSLGLGDLVNLNDAFESKSIDGEIESAMVEMIRSKAQEIQQEQASVRIEEEKKEANPDTEVDFHIECVKPESTKQGWTKDELSALAKGVKKHPAGSLNRWDSIANFVNHACPGSARTKGDCVEKYNQIRNASGTGSSTASQSKVSQVNPAQGAAASSAPVPDTTFTSSTSVESGWTQEQDQLLQDGLAKFPATMDKNERWDCIAKSVPSKTKKECVQRFKTIREALLLKTKK